MGQIGQVTANDCSAWWEYDDDSLAVLSFQRRSGGGHYLRGRIADATESWASERRNTDGEEPVVGAFILTKDAEGLVSSGDVRMSVEISS